MNQRTRSTPHARNRAEAFWRDVPPPKVSGRIAGPISFRFHRALPREAGVRTLLLKVGVRMT